MQPVAVPGSTFIKTSPIEIGKKYGLAENLNDCDCPWGWKKLTISFSLFLSIWRAHVIHHCSSYTYIANAVIPSDSSSFLETATLSFGSRQGGLCLVELYFSSEDLKREGAMTTLGSIRGETWNWSGWGCYRSSEMVECITGFPHWHQSWCSYILNSRDWEASTCGFSQTDI